MQGQAELLWLGLNAAVVLPTLPFGVLAGLPGELPWLVLVTPVLVGLLVFLRLDAHGIWELWVLLVLPFAAALLPALAFLAFQLWIAVRFSPGATLGAGVVATLLALILGGTGLGGGI